LSALRLLVDEAFDFGWRQFSQPGDLAFMFGQELFVRGEGVVAFPLIDSGLARLGDADLKILKDCLFKWQQAPFRTELAFYVS